MNTSSLAIGGLRTLGFIEVCLGFLREESFENGSSGTGGFYGGFSSSFGGFGFGAMTGGHSSCRVM